MLLTLAVSSGGASPQSRLRDNSSRPPMSSHRHPRCPSLSPLSAASSSASMQGSLSLPTLWWGVWLCIEALDLVLLEFLVLYIGSPHYHLHT